MLCGSLCAYLQCDIGLPDSGANVDALAIWEADSDNENALSDT